MLAVWVDMSTGSVYQMTGKPYPKSYITTDFKKKRVVITLRSHVGYNFSVNLGRLITSALDADEFYPGTTVDHHPATYQGQSDLLEVVST